MTYLRKNKRMLAIEEIDFVMGYQHQYDIDELNLYQNVNALPDKLRVIIILRFYEEMSLEEIATITKLNLSTVKSRLYKALKLLKLELKESDFYE